MAKKVKTILDLDNNRIINVANPINQMDATNKDFIDELFIDILNTGTWTYNNTITTPPAINTFRMNSTTLTSVTQIHIHNTDLNSFVATDIFDKLNINDVMLIQDTIDPSIWVKYRITGGGSIGSYFTFIVTYIFSIGTLTPNNSCKIKFISIGLASSSGSGDVQGPASSVDTAVAVFDGPTGKIIKETPVKITSNGSLILPENSNPTVSNTGEMKIFSRNIANRLIPAFIGPSGLDSALQPLLARNKIGYWNPPGNATTVPGVFGFTAPTVTNFTATARYVVTTNMFTRMRRLGYVTAATAGSIGNWRVGINQYTLGVGTGLGGFTFIMRFGISDATLVTGARMFMGMRVSATPTNVEPSTLTNCIGMGHGASDTNMFIYYGGSTAQTPINLGSNFPCNTSNTDVYELSLFSSPNNVNIINWMVTRLNTGHVASGAITGNATIIPQSNTLMAIWGYRTNNATALAVGLDVMSCYIETDQ